MHKKFKHFKPLVAFGSVAVAGVPVISSVAMSTNVDTKQNEINQLRDYFNNPDQMIEWLKNIGVDKISNEAKNSQEYLRIANELKQVQSLQFINQDWVFEKIQSANLTPDLKRYFVHNYYDKYALAQAFSIRRETFRERIRSQDPRNPHEVFELKSPNDCLGTTLRCGGSPDTLSAPTLPDHLVYKDLNGVQQAYLDDNGRQVPRHGKDGQDGDYGFFQTDVTHIYWSNQTVFDYGFYQAIEEWQKFGKSNEIINLLTKDFTDHKDEILKGLGTSTLNAHTKESIEAAIKEIGSSVENQFIKKISSLNLSTKLIRGAIINVFLSSLTADYSKPDGPIAGLVTNLTQTAIGAAINLAVTTIISKAVSSALLALAGPIGFVAGIIGSTLLDLIPSGNGHSIASNIGDGGLNDWDFQIKNNFETLVKIAISWSDAYKHGIVWKVTDPFWEEPELFIATQGDSSSEQHLSPGYSFNYGHKIGLWTKGGK